MKAINYITVLALLTLGSCTSSLYTGVEYDDLYFMPSDRAVVAKAQKPSEKQIVEGNLKADDYYDNIYAADTLVSDEYSEAVNSENEIINNYNRGYYDDYGYSSYSGRLRRFYGNYFDPYWRDQNYYGWGMPFSYGYYGNPYSFYDPFYYDPFYYSPYSNFYGGYNGGYYGGYGFSPFYSSYYSPMFGNWGWGGYSSNIRYNDNNSNVTYGRRERQSVYSTKWNSTVSPSASSRRDGYISKGTGSDATRRTYTNATGAADSRRTVSTVNTRDAVITNNSKSGQDVTRTQNASTARTNTTRSTVVTRPEYNSVTRTYTPSYNNPRMSSRPSYNNSRVSGESGQRTNQNVNTYNNSRSNSGTSTNRAPSYTDSYRYNGSGRTSSPSSVSAGQSRSSSSYSNSAGSYSVPSRRSVESGSGYSSGSFNSSSSRSSSSYNSGSSGGSVSRSYSSGGSSGGSSYSGGGGSSSGSSSSSSSGSSSGGSSSSGRR